MEFMVCESYNEEWGEGEGGEGEGEETRLGGREEGIESNRGEYSGAKGLEKGTERRKGRRRIGRAKRE